MRVYALRHRVIPGDRLVLRLGESEYLSGPIHRVGTEAVILDDGTLVRFPDGKGCEVERAD